MIVNEHVYCPHISPLTGSYSRQHEKDHFQQPVRKKVVKLHRTTCPYMRLLHTVCNLLFHNLRPRRPTHTLYTYLVASRV